MKHNLFFTLTDTYMQVFSGFILETYRPQPAHTHRHTHTHTHTFNNHSRRIDYEALTILFLSHTFQREGGSLLKVSYPNSWFLQFGLLSPRLFFASSTSLKGQIFKSSALFLLSKKKKKRKEKKSVIPPSAGQVRLRNLQANSFTLSVHSFRNLKHFFFILVADS